MECLKKKGNPSSRKDPQDRFHSLEFTPYKMWQENDYTLTPTDLFTQKKRREEKKVQHDHQNDFDDVIVVTLSFEGKKARKMQSLIIT